MPRRLVHLPCLFLSKKFFRFSSSVSGLPSLRSLSAWSSSISPMDIGLVLSTLGTVVELLRPFLGALVVGTAASDLRFVPAGAPLALARTGGSGDELRPSSSRFESS